MTHESNESFSERPHSSAGPLFIALLGVGFLVMNVVSFSRSWLLNYKGVVTQATVTAKHAYHRRGGVFYQADYVFDVGGRSIKDVGDISIRNYLELRPGEAMAVRYVPSFPTISETADMSHYSTTVFITAFLGFPASLFILFIAFRTKRMTIAPLSESADTLEEVVPSGPRIRPLNIVTGLAFTVYPVLDMARARRFYENDLGLRAARDLRGEWVEYHIWDNCFALTTLANDGVRPSAEAGGRVAFEVFSVDNFVAELRAKGTPIKTEPFSTPACRMAVILDPEGNALTLHSQRSAGQI